MSILALSILAATFLTLVGWALILQLCYPKDKVTLPEPACRCFTRPVPMIKDTPPPVKTVLVRVSKELEVPTLEGGDLCPECGDANMDYERDPEAQCSCHTGVAPCSGCMQWILQCPTCKHVEDSGDDS